MHVVYRPGIFPFLRLPAEIRNMVYSYLFQGSVSTASIRVGNRARLSARWLDAEDKVVSEKPSTNILALCRTISQEVASVFYGSIVFSFSGMSDLRTFLVGVGSCARLIRHVKVIYYSNYNARPAMDLLTQAVELRSLHLAQHQPYDHVFRPNSNNMMYNLTLSLKPLFEVLHNNRNDREAVVSILHIEANIAECAKGASGCAECGKAKEHKDKIMAQLRDRVFRYLSDRRSNEMEETAGNGNREEEDDYSYLIPQPAPARRETGRPRRRATLVTSYAED